MNKDEEPARNAQLVPEVYVAVPPGTTQQQLKDQFAKTIADGLPSKVWPGMTLKWNSLYTHLKLHVELPFWLLMPDTELTVTFQGCSLKAQIFADGVEIQDGKMFHISRTNVLHFEKFQNPVSERAKAVLATAKNGVILRRTRTIITICTKALEDCCNALNEDGRRHVDATMYFKSLVSAHFPFVNKIVNAYRKCAVDPFAMEVTEWDVPVWFVDFGNQLKRISLILYADAETFPNIGTTTGEAQEPIFLSTPAEVQAAIQTGEIPGDAEFLDAWALYYRGRFGDAIRSLVTAIEVVLEDRLKTALAKKGLDENEVEKRLQRTFNKFDERLSEFVQVTGKRMPGPIISVIPYINGVRLKWELEETRYLRHKIVHEGLRLDQSLRGELQRPMETMSWLFNWFRPDSPISATTQDKKYTLKSAMVGRTILFQPFYTQEGVVIKDFDADENHPHMVELIQQQLVDAIDKETSDVETFALTCFKKLGFKVIDTPPPEPDTPFLLERCVLSDSSKPAPVFLIDTSEIMHQSDVEQIATRMLALKHQGRVFSSALCIFNHQNGLSWQLREIENAIASPLSAFAAACGITLITAVDLLMLVNGAISHKWDLETIRNLLLTPGRQGMSPPNAKRIGILKHFYERPQVISIELDKGSRIRVGDAFLIRLPDRYYVQIIGSMQLNMTAVIEANGGDRVGIQTALHRGEISIGTPIFSISEGSPSQAATPSQTKL